MSLMFGVTAAADIDAPPVGGSQAYTLTAGYAGGGDVVFTGFQRVGGPFGSLQPDTPIKGAVVQVIYDQKTFSDFELTLSLSGAHPQDFIDQISLTGVFADAVSRTRTYLAAAAGYGVSADTFWNWTITGSDFMVEGNVYDTVIDWITP